MSIFFRFTFICFVSMLLTASPSGATAKPAALPLKKAAKRAQPLKMPEPAPNTTSDENSNEPAEPEVAPKRVEISSANAIRLNYGRNEWNRSATQVDAAAIFLKEGATGRIVQIEVEETAPDSAVFSGIYSVNWKNLDQLKVEFYAPPQALLMDLAGRRKITALIESKELRRLPFVMRKDPVTGVQNVELFDSPDQARFAYNAFQTEQQLLVALQNKIANRDQVLDTARLALEKQEFEEASRNLAERIRIGQLETQRLAKLLQGYTNASPEERTRRRNEASQLADQGLLDYKAGRFKEARESFEKAVDLDPSNRTYFFQYGITLYRLDDFNRSVVYLDLAEGKTVSPIEREYYKGLNFYKLKDSISGLAAFETVVNAKDPVLSPSSSYYRGMIYFDRKRWEEAKAEFQAVLDGSNDPAMDENSERYIEYILRMQQEEAVRSRKWTLSANVGIQYDDNVVLSSDSDRDRGTATNTAAWRTLIQGGARYRPIYTESEEFAAQLDLLTMYSVDTSMQIDQSIRNSDPTVIGLTLPWTHKGTWRGKGVKVDVVPGYEMTYMSIDNNEMKAIYTSYLGSLKNLIVMNQTWYTNLNFDLRQDNANISSATGDNDASALKSKLSWSNINMVSDDRKQMVLTDVAYTLNSALGKNAIYNRVDLGIGYVFPWKWETTVNSKLGYFLLTYPENSNNRVDNSYAVTAGLSKPVWTDVVGGLTGIYTFNNSNVEANQYKQFTLLLSFSTNKMF